MSIVSLNERFARAANSLQTPLLAVIRIFWGWQLVQTGWGKLAHVDKVADYFVSLGVPLARLSAIVVGSIELTGGCLLILGLASRVISVPLIVTLIMAYVLGDHAALAGIFKNPDGFTSAAPFLFLFATVIVLTFGPGKWSVDGALAKNAPRK